jgi:nitric oxide reductase large subunit
LKKPSQKSLPPSLFQKEESFWGIRWKIPLFPLWKTGSCEKIQPGEEKLSLQISRFFFWTAWVASTNRPGKDYTYTNNWPADRKVGNVPTPETYLWTLGGILKFSFWGFNLGLGFLTLGTLFPVGILQAWTSYKVGLWAARDASFFERGIVHFLGTVRVIPDLMIILLGVLPLAYFLFKTYPHLKAAEIKEGESVWDRPGIKL